MNSKKALDFFVENIDCDVYEFNTKDVIKYKKHLESDLNRLEQLADNIKIHKETIKMQQNQIESLQSKNEKLEKVIEILKKQNDGATISQEEYDLLKGVLENEK